MKFVDYILSTPGRKDRKLNLTLNSPGIYLVQGENGIGKTTLLEGVIFGSSESVVFDKEQNELYLNKRHQLFSYLPQNLAQVPIKALDYIKLDQTHFVKEELLAHLEILELDFAILKKNFNTLSDGEQVKVALITALLKNTPYIFLDEPTNNLDDSSVESLKKLIVTHASEKPFIIVTHDKRLASIGNTVISIDFDKVVLTKLFSDTQDSQDVEAIPDDDMRAKTSKNIPFQPLKTAFKLFKKPLSISHFLTLIVMVLGISFLNEQFLLTNYNTNTAPVENVILFSNGVNDDFSFFSYDEFNQIPIQELNIDITDVERGALITYEHIPTIASLDGVREIVLSDVIHWDTLQENINNDISFLESLNVINPPNVFWEGFDVWHWMVGPELLESGRFPEDGAREVTISRALLENSLNSPKRTSSLP